MKCSCFFRFCQLGFFVAQFAAWWIILTYCIVVLPNSKPTNNVYANYFLIGVNYIIHIICISFL